MPKQLTETDPENPSLEKTRSCCIQQLEKPVLLIKYFKCKRSTNTYMETALTRRQLI